MDVIQRSRKWALRAPLVAGMLGLLMAGPAAGERELMPLDQLLESADLVIAGVVTKVESAGTADETATIEVEQTLLGSPTSLVSVAGTPTDPEGHGFRQGDRGLMFLTASKDSTYHIVGGALGIFALGESTASSALDLVSAWHAKKDPTARLERLLVYVTSETPHLPVGLLTAATETFRQGPLPSVGRITLRDLACGNVEPANRSVHQWAVRMAGRLRMENARPCLESLIPIKSQTHPGFDVSLAQSAVAALVDLGGIPSVLILEDELAGLPQLALGSCDSSYATAILQGLGELANQGFPVSGNQIGKTAFRVPFRNVASTAVHALGLIRDREAQLALRQVARRHPDSLIRSQASITLARIGG